MTDAIDILQRRIDALNARAEHEQLSIDRVNAAISKSRSELASIEQRKAIIDATIENLNAVVTAMGACRDDEIGDLFDAEAQPETNRTERDEREPARASAAVAVRRLLENHRDGLSIREVVDALASQIETRSLTPRRVIQNTVYQLRLGGTLEQYKNEAGLHCVRLRA